MLIAFNARLKGKTVETMRSWLIMSLVFLNKTQVPRKMKDFRGIGLLDCFSKFYVGCLMSVAKRTTRLEHWWLKVVSMAYTPKCCTAHVALLISTLLHRCYEWDGKTSCTIFEGDIEAAFDNAKPRSVMIAMMEMKVPPLVIAAILNEQAGTKVQPEFDELECNECELNACIVQGGVHSTFCWNALVGYLIQLLLPVWLDKKMGVDLDEGIDDVHEGYVNHVVWSDNIWLIWQE